MQSHGRGFGPLEGLETTGGTSLSYNWSISDAGLTDLKALAALKKLDLADTRVGDEGLAALRELPALETLYLKRTKVTEAGAKAFQSARPKVKIDR